MTLRVMLNFLKNLLSKPTDLKSHLHGTKRVKIRGVLFDIKKIAIVDYLDGARVMQETFSTYKTKDEKRKIDDSMIDNVNKMKKYMTDIIMAAVVKPELSRDKDDGGKICVNDIFEDWILAQELVKEIMNYTHGKKK